MTEPKSAQAAAEPGRAVDGSSIVATSPDASLMVTRVDANAERDARRVKRAAITAEIVKSRAAAAGPASSASSVAPAGPGAGLRGAGDIPQQAIDQLFPLLLSKVSPTSTRAELVTFAKRAASEPKPVIVSLIHQPPTQGLDTAFGVLFYQSSEDRAVGSKRHGGKGFGGRKLESKDLPMWKLKVPWSDVINLAAVRQLCPPAAAAATTAPNAAQAEARPASPAVSMDISSPPERRPSPPSSSPAQDQRASLMSAGPMARQSSASTAQRGPAGAPTAPTGPRSRRAEPQPVEWWEAMGKDRENRPRSYWYNEAGESTWERPARYVPLAPVNTAFSIHGRAPTAATASSTSLADRLSGQQRDVKPAVFGQAGFASARPNPPLKRQNSDGGAQRASLLDRIEGASAASSTAGGSLADRISGANARDPPSPGASLVERLSKRPRLG